MRKNCNILCYLLCFLCLTGCGQAQTVVHISNDSSTEGSVSAEDSVSLSEESASSEDSGSLSDESEEKFEAGSFAGETTEKVDHTANIVQITINAVGDITLGSHQKQGYEKSFHEKYDQEGKDYFLRNVRELFAADDFTIANLEGTLTESEDKMDKLWNHKGKPEYVNILSEGHIEAVTLGNNHIMDYGEQGISDTIKNVEDAGLVYAMSNEWGNQYGLYETGQGIKIGFVSVNEHYDKEACYPYLEDGLATLREQGADIVIACTHWGEDKTHEVTKSQYKMGRWCIDAGYDVVLGAHAHIFQGIEIYKGKYIVYCLGNFCYGGNKNPPEKDSMIWQQTFTWIDGQLQDNTDVTVVACRLSTATDKNDYCPILLEGQEADELYQRLNIYCEQTGTYVDNEGKIHLLKEAQSNE